MTDAEILEFLNAVDWKMICLNALCILTIFIAAVTYPISKEKLGYWVWSDFISVSIFIIWLFQIVLTIFALCLWLKDLIITIIWWKAVIFFLYILIIWIGIVKTICSEPWDEDEWRKVSAFIWPIEVILSLLMITGVC